MSMYTNVKTQAPPQNAGRLFIIPKQSFREQRQLMSFSWLQRVIAKDQHGEEVHEWQMRVWTSFRGYTRFFNFCGTSKDASLRYEKGYCKVIIYDVKTNDFIMSQRRATTGVNNNSFCFDLLYDITQQDIKYHQGLPFTYVLVTNDEVLQKSFVSQKSMLDNNLLTDIVIETSNGDFPCHKVILASESNYFRAMFLTDMKENYSNRINWNGVLDASVVEDLLHFIYTGQKPPNIIQNRFALLEAANLCLLPKLKSLCFDCIRKNIDVENAPEVLQIANKYDVKDLKEMAVKFLVKNCEEVLKTKSYNDMDGGICKSMLTTVLSVVSKMFVVKNS